MPPTKRTRTQAELDAQHPLVVDEDLFGVGGHAPPTGAWQGAALGVARLVLTRRELLLVAASVALVEPAAAVDRAPDRMRRRLDMRQFISSMTDKEFTRYYCLPGKAAFVSLLASITPSPAELVRRRRTARLSTGGFVEYDVRLSMTLRFLAGGPYLDIMYLHGVARSTFYKHIYTTLAELDRALPEFTLDEDIHDLERCRHLARGFAKRTDGHIRGAIAALDGIIFKVEKPTQLKKDKVVNPNKFHCRKGFPGVSVQAVSDSDRRFTFMSMGFAASVHDARAFRFMRTRRSTLLHHELLHSETMAAVDGSHGHKLRGG